LQHSKNKEILRYIQSEIDLLKQFNHRNIIKYYDDQWVDNRYIYIVMEVGEMNLKQHIEVYGEDNSLKEKETISVGLEILRGLAQLHSKRIIHRDLKTENILYKQGVWKLSDFGIAIKLDEQEVTGTILGTPYYLAPEILRNENYSYKVDIWCFGIILFEVYFGHVPFYKEDMASPMELLEIIEKICVPRFDFGRLLQNYERQNMKSN
jgi:serine/threonine protein kinase